jgi:hypothetical protein
MLAIEGLQIQGLQLQGLQIQGKSDPVSSASRFLSAFAAAALRERIAL